MKAVVDMAEVALGEREELKALLMGLADRLEVLATWRRSCVTLAGLAAWRVMAERTLCQLGLSWGDLGWGW